MRDSAGTVFQPTEVDLFVKMAVNKYSIYRPLRKPFTLQVTAGQEQVQLPNDWIAPDLESFNKAIYPNGHFDFDPTEFASFVLPTINESYPLRDLNFDWYNDNQFVIVNPVPMQDVSIKFSYNALNVVDDTVSTVSALLEEAVCSYAAAQGLRQIAIDRGQKMQRYKIGQGLDIDDSSVSGHLNHSADLLERTFTKMVVDRPFGVAG